MQKMGKNVFVSYRGRYYEAATALGQWLVDNGYCESLAIFPPNSLCARNELLLPYEYVELMEFILDRLARSDAFVVLNTPDYQDSYFTQAEILQWRRFKDSPIVYLAGHDGKDIQLQAAPLASLEKDQKRMWANLSVSIARSYRGKMNPGFVGGKYNRSCFIFPCGNCGEHFLATKKAIYKALSGNFKIACPHCGNDRFKISEAGARGNYYRKPILLEQDYKTSLRILEPGEILSLLVENDLPSTFKLIALDDEALRSDMAKVGLFYLGLGVLAAGALVIASLFDGENNTSNNDPK